MPSDTEGAPDDPAREGGLKDDTATPPPSTDDQPASIESEEDAHGAEGGGMIGEG
jgi:hypothetical protein